MANFDTSISNNSFVKYVDNGKLLDLKTKLVFYQINVKKIYL